MLCDASETYINHGIVRLHQKKKKMNIEIMNFVFCCLYNFFLLISSITILIGLVLLIVDYDNIMRLLK